MKGKEMERWWLKWLIRNENSGFSGCIKSSSLQHFVFNQDKLVLISSVRELNGRHEYLEILIRAETMTLQPSKFYYIGRGPKNMDLVKCVHQTNNPIPKIHQVWFDSFKLVLANIFMTSHIQCAVIAPSWGHWQLIVINQYLLKFADTAKQRSSIFQERA